MAGRSRPYPLAEGAHPPRVLELRVHGVNNTTPAALLDLPPYDVRQIAGDTHASFWIGRPEIVPEPGARGHVPPGIRREAYSWGGLVRETARRQFWFTVLRLAFQMLALPFSIGNATMWTRRIATPTDPHPDRLWAALTAGLTRLFGLVLTLVFTATAITVAVDMIAVQCAHGAGCGGFWLPVIDIVGTGSDAAATLLAAAMLGPIGAVGVLVAFAELGRRRYDTVHKRRSVSGAAVATATAAPSPFAALPVLRHPMFWSNRITTHLGLLHFAAAIALVAWQVGTHARVGISATIAGVLQVLCAMSVTFLPTQQMPPRVWWGAAVFRRIQVWTLLVLTVAAALAVAIGILGTAGADASDRLWGAETVPHTLVTIAAAIALSGVLWRAGHRAHTAWFGAGPAVFMVAALALALLTSAATIAVADLALAGTLHFGVRLTVPAVFVLTGAAAAVALVLTIGVVLVDLLVRLVVRRDFTGRAGAWDSPRPPESLRRQVGRARRASATAHLMEPIVGLLTILLLALLTTALVAGWAVHETTLDAALSPDARAWLMGAIAAVGLVLAAGVVLLGALRPTAIAIVWDITCFLPRTAQPFGPPCYAERAVPDLTDRISDWLDEDDGHRVILAAHSMGGVVALAALAFLASTEQGARKLQRVALLTFGVQIRVFFGRFLPELVGAEVLGTLPSRAPRVWSADPWAVDTSREDRPWPGREAGTVITHLDGPLLPGGGVRWINLWRLTDFLGFPAASGLPTVRHAGVTWRNGIDRYANEIDETVDDPGVVRHNGYFRVSTYTDALTELAAELTGDFRPSAEGSGPARPVRGIRGRWARSRRRRMP